MKSTENGN